jgi:hypothetical protein
LSSIVAATMRFAASEALLSGDREICSALTASLTVAAARRCASTADALRVSIVSNFDRLGLARLDDRREREIERDRLIDRDLDRSLLRDEVRRREFDRVAARRQRHRERAVEIGRERLLATVAGDLDRRRGETELCRRVGNVTADRPGRGGRRRDFRLRRRGLRGPARRQEPARRRARFARRRPRSTRTGSSEIGQHARHRLLIEVRLPCTLAGHFVAPAVAS